MYWLISFNSILAAVALAFGIRSWVRLNRMKKGLYLLAKKFYEGGKNTNIQSWFLNREGKSVPFESLEDDAKVFLIGVGYSYKDMYEIYMDLGRKKAH